MYMVVRCGITNRTVYYKELQSKSSIHADRQVATVALSLTLILYRVQTFYITSTICHYLETTFLIREAAFVCMSAYQFVRLA